MTNREAAEAMREAAAQIVEIRGYEHWDILADRIRAIPLPADTAAPAPAPTDEQIAAAMVRAYMKAPARSSMLETMHAALAVAKPLIRQQMES